jgi:hydroxymethylbilane synthase
VSSSTPIRLATRRSPLALCQAELAAAWVLESLPEHQPQLLPMTTTGDERQQWSLETEGGKGLFTRELERALLEGAAELAVHSAKDLPTCLPDGLCIAGYLPRADAADVLVHVRSQAEVQTLATSSPRRRAQLQKRFPNVQWTTLRGNVGTRLRKLSEGAADGTILAAAGLARLAIDPADHPQLSFSPIPLEEMVPAPGQGAIALECREQDHDRFAALLCPITHYAVTIEKRLLALLGGGCQTPIGAHYTNSVLHIFHPKIGKQSLALPNALSSGEIDRQLTGALREWQLLPENDV